MRTCLHCQHWRFSETNQAGERMPGWLIHHGFAACAQGLSWEALPGRNVCGNGQFSGLPESDVQKRAAWLEAKANG